MDQLPTELHHRLALELAYVDLLNLSKTSHIYIKIFSDDQFWENKIIHDFSLPWNLIRDVIQETGSPQIAYIRIAAEHNIPFWGAEKYGRIQNLTVFSAHGDDFPLIKYFYDISGNSKIFVTLAKRNKSDWIDQLSPIDISNAIGGALAGGHLDLVKKFLHHPMEVPLSGWELSMAVESGNIDIVQFVIDLMKKKFLQLVANQELEKDEAEEMFVTDLQIAAPSAVEYGYYDILDLLFQLGGKNFSETLDVAAKKGDMNMIRYLISNSDQDINWNAGLFGACEGGFREIIDFMIQKGADNLNQGIASAALSGHIHIIQYLLSLGGNLSSHALEVAVRGNQLATVKYLLDHGTQVKESSILEAVDNDYLDIFTVLWDNKPNDISSSDIIDRAVKWGSGKILRQMLKLYNPVVNSSLITQAGRNVNIVVQLIDYQISRAKQNLHGVLILPLKIIYPNN